PPQARAQASLAISADRERWFLVNAAPDLAGSLERIARPPANGQPRHNPIDAVLLTDAELDHTAGLLSLRETPSLTVVATAWVHRTAAPLLGILSAYCVLHRQEVGPGVERPLDGSPLTYRAVPTGSTKRPRYAAHRPPDPTAVVGYRFTDVRTGGSLLYLPCVPALDDRLLAEFAVASCVLLDGTCWSDDELARVGLSEKTSRSMGHLPVSGADGSLATLAGLPAIRRIYTHLNNTNPLLVEDSVERKQVEALGVEVAYDGMEVEVR
ncbi:MAG: pyrroloquinoline quinone biosynthesis protein PqqB, partial [Micromonosporaceae bacterium]